MQLLLIEDELSQRELLKEFLEERNYKVIEAPSGEKAISLFEKSSVDMVLLDFRLPGMSGIEVLKKLRNINPSTIVIMITAYGSIENAVESLKEGAYHYLTKPINLENLIYVLKKAEEQILLKRENEELRKRISEKFKLENFITSSKKMEEILNLVGIAAKSEANILITGENGTGKELIANIIHQISPRNNKPFIKVNLSAIPETLIEAELFGAEKGAYTGADKRRIGKFEAASEGTIFLDEVGELPLHLQVKLLRALQEREIQRLGSNEPVKVDMRLIAATNKNLEESIRSGSFREDLYYRLNVIHVHLPPLRERKEDVPLLIDHFIKKYNIREKKNISTVSKEVMDILLKYDYPGNIRELENIIERTVILSRSDIITTSDLPFFLRGSDKVIFKEENKGNLSEQVEILEKRLILDALERNSWIQTKAADELGISERVLRYKMKKYGIKIDVLSKE
ncbi:MAG: sigma-54 dependent transcriptional regulator [Acidobacteriota bacterium]